MEDYGMTKMANFANIRNGNTGHHLEYQLGYIDERSPDFY